MKYIVTCTFPAICKISICKMKIVYGTFKKSVFCSFTAQNKNKKRKNPQKTSQIKKQFITE